MRAQRIRNRLLQRRRQLLSRYHDELARVQEELDSREIEEIDNANELWDARLSSRLSNIDAQALARIVDALRRIEQGEYGKCLECGVVIEPARLMALPETESCYECAMDAELQRPALRAAQ
jgi:RNA polymerase-binding transcription factor